LAHGFTGSFRDAFHDIFVTKKTVASRGLTTVCYAVTCRLKPVSAPLLTVGDNAYREAENNNEAAKV
jgi:hypothetical protein